MKPLYAKRMMAALCALFVAAGVLLASAQAEMIPNARERSQLVRVHLTRLGVENRIDITLEGGFYLQAEGAGEHYFQSGSELSILLKNGLMYLYYENMAFCAGSSLKLERTEVDGGFYLTNFPAFYQGDLTLDIAENKIRPVLYIHVEDYLKGVVPYEMSDSFPLEALKAQAVAARTYALRRQDDTRSYDVVDNTNDQVFKGYIAGNAKAEQAIAETRGVCGFYKGELAQCFYSASNGGQTELPETVWPQRGSYGYYAYGEDPYDVENPQSVVRSFELLKHYPEPAPYVLRKYLSETLGELLKSLGYDPAPESIRVDEVISAAAEEPVQENDKRMTVLRLSLRISGRTRSDGVIIRLVDSDTEEVSLFQQSPVTQPPVLLPTQLPQEEPEIVYGSFEPINQEIMLSIPIFPDAEDAFGMDISTNYENEIWTVSETEEKFVLEARRYGHGVGMSQRGAQWMAGTYEKSYREILDFYYPGMELKRYPEMPVQIANADSALSETAGPAPSPTPRPTLMPVTQTAAQGQWYAEVTEIADDSSLNLRAAPSLNAEIAMRLYKGQRLLVAERCPEEGWVRVLTDAAEGYVMEKYLTRIP